MGHRCLEVYKLKERSFYVIEIYALVDVKMKYTRDVEVHVGTQREREFKLENSNLPLVIRLCQSSRESNRNVIFDPCRSTTERISSNFY